MQKYLKHLKILTFLKNSLLLYSIPHFCTGKNSTKELKNQYKSVEKSVQAKVPQTLIKSKLVKFFTDKACHAL